MAQTLLKADRSAFGNKAMKILKSILALTTVLMSVASTSALTITYLPPIRSGNINSVADLNAALGFNTGDQMWDKSDGGGTHDGDFTQSTGGTSTAGFTMTFHYVGSSPLPNIDYAALKASNNYLLFSISGWNGEDIVLVQDKILNTNGKFKGISHGILFGKPGTPPPPKAPDAGATAGLLGLGMLALTVARKSLK
jgi:hypothetical protein